eukprot:365542-Chlamydomonas_euryale.AAC.8
MHTTLRHTSPDLVPCDVIALHRYAAFADDMLGKWGKKGNGQSDPSVRTLAKPLLMLFYAEPGSKRWKAAVDAELKKVGHRS